MQLMLDDKGVRGWGALDASALTDLDCFLKGDRVPSDLPLGTVPQPPHLEGEGVRAWESHQWWW